jgi:2-polyprenyl-6-methoxyphenol hydroxylase-like FAD-dependent oxidoreductase
MKILIVGAGIVGLAMARRLEQSGHEYSIIERTEGWSSDGAGICLPANAVAGMEKLGLKDELMAISHQVEQINFVKDNGKTLSSASLLEPPLDQQPFVSLPRKALLGLLRQGMDQKVRFGMTLSLLEATDDGMDVQFSNGEREHFALVVAADGIHSQVRGMILDDPEALSFEVTNWRFVIDQDTSKLQPTYYLGAESLFMRYPMPNNQVYCYAHTLDAYGEVEEFKVKQRLRSLFANFDQNVKDSIESVTSDTEVISGRLHSVEPHQVYKDSVVLIGDALHGCPPSLQQGVGMGLEDVHCLADLLVEDEQIACEELLAKFKVARLERITWVVEHSNQVIHLADKGKSFFGRLVRNFIVRKGGPPNVAGWRKLLSSQ